MSIEIDLDMDLTRLAIEIAKLVVVKYMDKSIKELSEEEDEPP